MIDATKREKTCLCSSNSTAINEAQYSKKKNRLLIGFFELNKMFYRSVCVCVCVFVFRICRDKNWSLNPFWRFQVQLTSPSGACYCPVRIGLYRQMGNLNGFFRVLLKLIIFRFFIMILLPFDNMRLQLFPRFCLIVELRSHISNFHFLSVHGTFHYRHFRAQFRHFVAQWR